MPYIVHVESLEGVNNRQIAVGTCEEAEQIVIDLVHHMPFSVLGGYSEISVNDLRTQAELPVDQHYPDRHIIAAFNFCA